MTEPKSTKLKLAEVGFWVLLIGVLWVVNTYVLWVNYERQNVPVETFRLLTNETTSLLAFLILIPGIASWSRKYPLTPNKLLVTAAAHILGWIVFSLAHSILMAAGREIIYLANGLNYQHAFGVGLWGLTQALGFEMAKDLPLYFGVVVIMSFYRNWRNRHPETNKNSENDFTQIRGDKILIRRGKSDRAISISEIDWLQAAANYVEVYSNGNPHIIRSTLSEMETKLSSHGFLRVHRSFLINANKVDEISGLPSGGYRITLICGSHVPLSRSYKDAVYEFMQA